MSTQPQPSVSSVRITATQQAVDHWERQLVDNTGGSPLLVYRDLKVGTLDLTPTEDRGIDRRALNNLLAGVKIHLSSLFPADPSEETEELADARKRLKSISRKAQAYREEKGTDTLFIGVGLATWEREGSGRSPNAPVILLPFSAIPEGAAHREFALEIVGDAGFNPVLRQEFRTAYGVELSDDDLEDLPDSYVEIQQFLQELEQRWAKVPGLRIEPRLVARDFHYTNMPLVDDLKNNIESFAESDVVAAIAGVEEARGSLNTGISDPPANQPDVDPPEAEFLILDADSSQHRAINRVLAGQSVVIWGPPGTGKSQTIANLIAALMAQSKRVLFVAQKQAAVEVVINRLRRVGLSDLVMDCHGGIKSKREFARSLADSIQHIGTIPATDYTSFYEELSDRRQSLLSYADTLHRLREPWNISAYEVQAGLLGRPKAAVTGIRLQPDKARELSREAVARLKDQVREWIDLEGPYLATRYPEWANAPVVKDEDARQALGLAIDLSETLLPRCRSLLADAAKETGLTLPDTPAEWPALLDLMTKVKELSDRFKPGIYGLNHLELVTALQPRGNILSRWGANFSGSYRSAKGIVASELRMPGKLSGKEAYDAVENAAEQVHRWRSYQPRDSRAPAAPSNLAELQSAVEALLPELEMLEKLTGLEDWRRRAAGQLTDTLKRMGTQQALAARLPRIRKMERGFRVAGVERIINLVGKEIGADEAPDAVERCWFQAVWEEMVFGDSLLSGFVGDTHSRNREDFAEGDRQHLEHTPERVKRAAAEAATATMNQYSQEVAIVKRQGSIKSRHLSVRELFRQTPNLMTALRPCWMMSPLQVAELVPVGRNLFDVVIFDEASQIPPAEAIGSLARAAQFVVAGDERQLPPTSFFASAADDVEGNEEDEEGTGLELTSDIESLLDAVKALPVREQMLQWHYRSRDGRLIDFSNTHIYGDNLTAFPGTARETPITFHQLDLPPIASRSTVSHPNEVEKVVDLIIDHALGYPDESLGVIAFGIRHADNIEEALRRRLSAVNDSYSDAFFGEDATEKFFVKNIERVQGDERDVIILSIGYHKAADGVLRYRFGPLNQEGGERRLNVAITRARSRMHLVSSFSHHDMEPGRSNARGVDLLRQYLAFAASGGKELGGALSGEPLNPFELDVMSRLEARGVPVTPQYGVAGYRIDFACAHPDQPGRMVLAIEADGASYHSTPTARERDRLRQEVLENLGWRFHRIWSTDWFQNREEAADRAVTAWQEAVKLADREDAGQQVAQPSTMVSLYRATPTAPAQPGRVGPCPIEISPGMPITDYSKADLAALARWIMSDTLLRTNDDLMLEMRRELGFKRSGSRIDAALQEAIAAAGQQERKDFY